MANTSWITAPFGRATNSVSLLLMLAAVLLVVLAGMFLVAGALLGMLFAAGPEGPTSPALFLAAIVLLLLILILLFIILLCCCGGKDRKLPFNLLQLIPLISYMPEALRKTADALRGGGTALGHIQGKVELAGGLITTLADLASNFEVTVPIVSPVDYPLDTALSLISSIDESNTEPLTSLKDGLNGAGVALQGHVDAIDEAIDDMETAATALDTVATALGA